MNSELRGLGCDTGPGIGCLTGKSDLRPKLLFIIGPLTDADRETNLSFIFFKV
jgi:hypothetical protein